MTDNRDYACAKGAAILAFNEAETEIFGLTEAIEGDELSLKLETKFLRDKLIHLKKVAQKIRTACRQPLRDL